MARDVLSPLRAVPMYKSPGCAAAANGPHIGGGYGIHAAQVSNWRGDYKPLRAIPVYGTVSANRPYVMSKP